MNNKQILVFSDLEGTLIGETSGVYDEENMRKFLMELVRLQVVTGAEVKLHLVSPVYRKDMERILKQIDRSILRFNAHQPMKENKFLLSTVQGAGAYPEETIDTFYISAFERHVSDHRITDLRIPIGQSESATGALGKEEYVRDWVRAAKNRGNLLFSIYMGNGRNDLIAINYLKKQGDALILSPANSIQEVKDKSYFSSDKEELAGIAEGIGVIIAEIEKRIKTAQNNLETTPLVIDDGEQR